MNTENDASEAAYEALEARFEKFSGPITVTAADLIEFYEEQLERYFEFDDLDFAPFKTGTSQFTQAAIEDALARAICSIKRDERKGKKVKLVYGGLRRFSKRK